MKSEQGELIGTQKLTQASNGQAFQIGSSYQITAPQLASPQLQARYTVAEPNQHTVHFSAAAPFQEVTFVYSKPELVLHYTFDEEVNQTVVDHSGKGNHGTIMGNPQWDDWGRVGGMLTDTGLKAQKSLEI
ncbi:MAG: hypothetical protein Q4B28_03475 [bacterium]|nr:hypothetical protein [bacterium]